MATPEGSQGRISSESPRGRIVAVGEKCTDSAPKTVSWTKNRLSGRSAGIAAAQGDANPDANPYFPEPIQHFLAFYLKPPNWSNKRYFPANVKVLFTSVRRKSLFVMLTETTCLKKNSARTENSPPKPEGNQTPSAKR